MHYPSSVKPEIDPEYQNKLNAFKNISPFFGDNSHGNLFRASLETNELQWLGSAITYFADDEHIYFLELPIDLDQYGIAQPNGDVVFHNSLCRMEKDGSNPVLIRSEIYQVDYITSEYIYTPGLRIDTKTFESEEIPYSSDTRMHSKAVLRDKTFYSKWETENDPPFYSVHCYDSVTKKTVKITEYPNAKYTPGLELIPLEDGGLIIWQSDNSKREIRQVAKIHFFDKNYNLEKTIDANGRYDITVKGDKVFYVLQEINDGKPIDSYLTETTYATLTLCSDDISMQGENVVRIGVIDDSVYY